MCTRGGRHGGGGGGGGDRDGSEMEAEHFASGTESDSAFHSSNGILCDASIHSPDYSERARARPPARVRQLHRCVSRKDLQSGEPSASASLSDGPP